MINDILHVQTISQLPSVWDVGLSSAARGGDLAGAVVGGGVLPRACLHRGPGRDHEAGKLAQPRASASVHSRGGWERDCLSHQCVAQSTVGQLGADICTVAWNWLASTRGRTMAGHTRCCSCKAPGILQTSYYLYQPLLVSVRKCWIFLVVVLIVVVGSFGFDLLRIIQEIGLITLSLFWYIYIIMISLESCIP